jgi:hypothetical protein
MVHFLITTFNTFALFNDPPDESFDYTAVRNLSARYGRRHDGLWSVSRPRSSLGFCAAKTERDVLVCVDDHADTSCSIQQLVQRV